MIRPGMALECVQQDMLSSQSGNSPLSLLWSDPSPSLEPSYHCKASALFLFLFRLLSCLPLKGRRIKSINKLKPLRATQYLPPWGKLDSCSQLNMCLNIPAMVGVAAWQGHSLFISLLLEHLNILSQPPLVFPSFEGQHWKRE